MSHRAPPLPAHYYRPQGRCRWCGGDDLPRKKDGSIDSRRGWHPACVNRYREVADPSYQRMKLRQRDKGKCASCGIEAPDWEADHVVPLWKVDRAAEGALWYWTLANMQTLCPACHKAKTASEAGERAKVERIRRRRLGIDKQEPLPF